MPSSPEASAGTDLGPDTGSADLVEEPSPEHTRPDGVDDATVEALGKLSEAFEVVEDARG